MATKIIDRAQGTNPDPTWGRANAKLLAISDDSYAITHYQIHINTQGRHFEFAAADLVDGQRLMAQFRLRNPEA